MAFCECPLLFNPDRQNLELRDISTNWTVSAKTLPKLIGELTGSRKEEIPSSLWQYVAKVNELLQALNQCAENALILVPSNSEDDFATTVTMAEFEKLFPVSVASLPPGILTPETSTNGGDSDSEQSKTSDAGSPEFPSENPKKEIAEPMGSDDVSALKSHEILSPLEPCPSDSDSIVEQWVKELDKEQSIESASKIRSDEAWIFNEQALKWDTVPAGVVRKRCFFEVIENQEEAVQCQVSYSESQARFFVTPASEARVYMEMENRLQDVAEIMKMEGFGFNHYPKGYPCAARYTVDGRWYRAEIVSQGSDACFLQFIDYGNTGFVPLKDILPLPLDFAELPAGAIQCRLAGVDTRELSSALVSLFKSEISEGVSVIVVPKEVRHQPKGEDHVTWDVELKDRTTLRNLTERYQTPKSGS